MKPLELTNLETAGLCRQLALLMHSGVAAGDALNLLAEEEENKKIRALLEGMTAAMDGGAYLSQAFEEAGCFTAYVTGLLTVGEQVGRTEETLNALADYYENRERTTRQLIHSLTYPAVLLLLMAVVIVILLSQVLPVFSDIYASLGGRLTGVAGGLLLLGQMIDTAIPVLGALLALAFLAGLTVYVHRGLRAKALAWFNARWGDKGIFRRMNNARFAEALSMGFTSGLPMEDAVDLAALLLAEVPAAQARCSKCGDMLRAGEDLAAALSAGDLMQTSSCRLLALGLRSGTGDSVMESIAKRMQEEASEALESMVSKVEPALVLLTSVLVGVILMSVMLPLMNIMTAIG